MHVDLETRLAAFVGMPASLTTTSGAAANLLVMSALTSPEDTVVLDRFVHDSVRRVAAINGARVVSVDHNDARHFRAAVRAVTSPRVWVVVDGLYSMHGDLPNLEAIAEIKSRREGVLVVVDDAHATGTTGPTGAGSTSLAGGAAIDIVTGSLGKALGAAGGFVAARLDVIDALHHLGPAPFTGTLAPPDAAAALAALRVLQSEPDRVVKLRRNSLQLREVLETGGIQVGGSPGAPILPIHFGSEHAGIRAARRLTSRHGWYAPVVVWPAVPQGQAMLRVTASSARPHNATEDLGAALIQVCRDELVPR